MLLLLLQTLQNLARHPPITAASPGPEKLACQPCEYPRYLHLTLTHLSLHLHHLFLMLHLHHQHPLPPLHLLLFPLLAHAATFNVVNQCTYTVWAAGVPGGGQQLDPGQSWTVTAPAGTTGGRIWARTGCSFDANGQGSCQTGDCGGVLQCTAYGAPPDTLAEYALGQFQNLDFYDISLVDGFNVPMDFTPTSGGCHDINCSADVVGQCPAALKLDGACANPCTIFKTDEYCCTGSAANNCGPTDYSKYFKGLCPDAYSYPKDDQTSTFTCPTGTDYKVTFCP